jgi:hypothetical protein
MQALCSKFDNWGTGHQVIEKAYLDVPGLPFDGDKPIGLR